METKISLSVIFLLSYLPFVSAQIAETIQTPVPDTNRIFIHNRKGPAGSPGASVLTDPAQKKWDATFSQHGADHGSDISQFRIVHPAPDTARLLAVAREFIHTHLGDWGLTEQDLVGMTVNDLYTDKSSGITRIYFLQRYQGIPVYNAILNLNIDKNGRVFFAGNRFVPHLAEKVNTVTPVLNPGEAALRLAAHLGLSRKGLRLKKQSGQREYIFDKDDVAKEDISVMLSYQPHGDKVLLAWDVLFCPVDNWDKWSARLDAIDGALLNKFNWTAYCKEKGGLFEGTNTDCGDEDLPLIEQEPGGKHSSAGFDPPILGAQYKVWPAPIESPVHGSRSVVADPADPLASPFGWHDINGEPGAEYTITLGNNTWVYQDRKDTGVSSHDEPDGGANLHFDFPYNPSWEPEQYTNASAVNLFYWLNYMHDFAYRFGFDETAGNFQINNYGRGGAGNDFIYGVVQAGADVGYANESFYRHGNEGSASTIFMSVFHRLRNYLVVTEPAVVAGEYATIPPDAGWGAGAYVADVPVSGEVVLVEDGIEESSTSDACEEILNTSELAGKIALIDRGSCMFSLKALRAQNAGAIGVIICNYNDEQYGAMFPGDYGADIQIPVVLISAKSSQVIRQYIGKGLKVSLVKTDQNAPLIYDVCLDNGIIAHEYGHGISWRLAGGPSLVCLDNQEQMDEGWSDFFGLVTTVKPGDTGANPRGLGGYLTDEQGTNGGIRRFPYSTDMNLNPLTYGYISNSKTLHDMGEVWASTLWDMYWALSDKYGWSANPYDETSGNNKAVRLVFDGLKNLPCNPGFLDGRNAILAADEVLNNGENACLIWSVFARRGMGYSADQGSPFSAGDQKEAFDVLPVCAGKMLIEKSVTGFIQPGEEIQVTIGVGNFRQETATNVVVTDEIPAGTAFKPGSSNFPATVQGNTIAFNLGNMNFKEESTITYTLETDPKAWSKRKFLDEVPDKSGANWRTYTIGDMAPNFWAVTDEFPAHSGNFAWNSKEIQTSSRQALELNPDAYTFHAEGERPTLRFYHRYQTTTILSGGIVEAREVGSSTWQQLGDDMLRNGYPCFVHYQTFGLPNLRGFSGNSGAAFKASYVDLSKWAGKNIQLRFRMGTVDLDEPTANAGWLIDDIEFMDLLTYNGEACVKSDQGDIECAVAPEAGTIVDSKAELVEVEDQLNEYTLKIYPNPASDRITAALSVAGKQRISISVLSLDGRTLFSKPLDVTGNEYLDIDTSLLPSGLYFVKIDSREGSLVRKVAIQK